MSAALEGGIQSPLMGTLIFSAVSLFLGFISIGRPMSLPRTGVMMLPMLLLAALVAVGRGHETLIVATVLAAAGEALLAQERAWAFVGGLGAFLAVRVVYGLLFVLDSHIALFAAEPWRSVAAVIVVAVIAAAFGRIRKHAGSLKGAAALYMLVLVVMSVAAAGIHPPAVFAGAALLAISDIALATRRFLTPADKDMSPTARRLAWLGRYAGQALIIFAAVGLA